MTSVDAEKVLCDTIRCEMPTLVNNTDCKMLCARFPETYYIRVIMKHLPACRPTHNRETIFVHITT